MARYIQIFCLSALNLINHRNVSDIKLPKYCYIDARLVFLKIFIMLTILKCPPLLA